MNRVSARVMPPLEGPVHVPDIVARFKLSGPSSVSNWRKRYDDFPEPHHCKLCGGTGDLLTFDGAAVEEWAQLRGKSYIKVRV